MIEDIKKKIDKNKEDKEVYKKYVKSFCDSAKAKELFKNSEDFNNVCKQFETNKKEEEFDD